MLSNKTYGWLNQILYEKITITNHDRFCYNAVWDLCLFSYTTNAFLGLIFIAVFMFLCTFITLTISSKRLRIRYTVPIFCIIRTYISRLCVCVCVCVCVCIYIYISAKQRSNCQKSKAFCQEILSDASRTTPSWHEFSVANRLSKFPVYLVRSVMVSCCNVTNKGAAIVLKCLAQTIKLILYFYIKWNG